MRRIPSLFSGKVVALSLTAVLSVLLASGCSVVKRVGVAVLYEKAVLPADRVVTDLAYGPDPRHRLNLFLPPGKPGGPLVVFVHGGSWVEGSKDLKVGGADVYGNIGRFLAANGIAAAVINYRLQPQATWREQVADVARATAWVDGHIADYGGKPGPVFLFGHSAGAQLAAYTGLNPEPLRQAGLPADRLRGVIAVSGAGLDLEDPVTYQLGHRREYYAGILNAGGTSPDWAREASAVRYIQGNSPPFLVMVGGSEEKAMIRQSFRLHEALSAAGVPNRYLPVSGQTHGRIVLTLSRPDKLSGPAVLQFLRENAAGSRTGKDAATLFRSAPVIQPSGSGPAPDGSSRLLKAP